MPPLTRRRLIGASLALLLAPPALAWQPPGPVTLIIPFAAGGATDRLAELIAPALSARLGVPVLIEHRAGDAGQRAMRDMLAAPADGRFLVLGNLGLFAFNPHLFERLSYDPLADLTPIGLLGTSPMILLASQHSGITDIASLRRQAERGPLTIASAGRGSTLHMGGVMLMRALGNGGELVPYSGGGPAREDLEAGLLDIMVDQAITAIPATHLGARAIAVLGPQRLPELATVPTAAEIGLAMPELAIWNLLAIRAGAPPAVIEGLAGALEGLLGDEMVAQRLAAESMIPPEGAERGPLAAAELIRAEHARWGRFIRAARME